MLSKSKLKKLKDELSDYGFTIADLCGKVNRSAPHLLKIFNGDKYEYEVVSALIGLRDTAKADAKKLEEAI
jgi:hypothetical protein